jgi:NTE family protein
MTRKTVGLALSGGGARGFAHVGVLKALQDNEIPIDCVAGTSAGSFVGAAVAAV